MRRLISIAHTRRFLSARDGTTAIEYALIASGISVAVVVSVSTLGTTIVTIFYDKLVNLF
jgi:Flp pilus assembly pilin Flp